MPGAVLISIGGAAEAEPSDGWADGLGPCDVVPTWVDGTMAVPGVTLPVACVSPALLVAPAVALTTADAGAATGALFVQLMSDAATVAIAIDTHHDRWAGPAAEASRMCVMAARAFDRTGREQ